MLRLPPFRYLAPRHLDEAAQMLEEEGDQAMLVAGGTDLYPNMKRRQFTPPVLIGLRALPELKTISGSPEQGMRIEAGVTRHRLAKRLLEAAPARLIRLPYSRCRSSIAPGRGWFYC